MRRFFQSPITNHQSPLSNGFTLIEILVVVVIVGVLVVAVTLAFGTVGVERSLEREGERFRALVAYACNRAELGGRDVGIHVDAGGYAFSRSGLAAWQRESDGELRPRRWTEGLRVTLSRDGRALDDARADAAVPQLVCFASGELTPFVLELAAGDAPLRYRVSGEAGGRVTLERVEARR